VAVRRRYHLRSLVVDEEMNPWAILLILLGIVFIIIGFHGSQHNVLGALKGTL